MTIFGKFLIFAHFSGQNLGKSRKKGQNIDFSKKTFLPPAWILFGSMMKAFICNKLLWLSNAECYL